jgi:LmbE family N-acetylglucosaminyl deacetylase
VENGFEHNRILVIVAHPDDVDFSIAGSVALWTRARKVVGYCVATSGEKGFADDLSVEERMNIREEEQRAAARLVGVEEVFFLRQPDGELQNTPGLQKALVAVMRKFKPDVVVTRDPSSWKFDSFYGYHPDHRAIGEAAYDALYPAVGNRFYFPELLEAGLEPHKVKEVLFGPSSSADYYIDISETFELKVRAIRAHVSQVSREDELEDHMRAWAGRIGKPKGLELAEAFRRMKHPDAEDSSKRRPAHVKPEGSGGKSVG